jgi:hypothetical protein
MPPEGRPLAAPAASPSPHPAPVAPAPAPPVHIGSRVPYTLHFDTEMQRFILEARDPVSGIVIFQMPPKSAFREMEATVGEAAGMRRGGSFDRSA